MTVLDRGQGPERAGAEAIAGAAPGARVDVAFPALDSLRAIGALAVVTTHVSFVAGAYTEHRYWGTLLARMDVGVALFFVLSGFLLSRPWLARGLDGRTRPSTGRYYWKRFLRIVPLYLVATVAALSLLSENAARSGGQWVVSLLLLDQFDDRRDPAGLTHLWSLAVEASFYVLLPLLMWLAVGRRRFRPRRVLVLLVAMIAIACWWHLDGAARAGSVTSGSPLQWLPAYGAWFAVGIGLALTRELHVRGQAPRLTEPIVALGRQPGSCWAIAGGLMLLSATPLAGPSLLVAPTAAESLTKSLIYAAVGGLVVCTGVFTAPGGYARAMSRPWFRHLGVISYGIFALHLPLLELILEHSGWSLFRVPLLPLWLVTVALSLVAAELAYRLVERPALRLKDVGRRGRSRDVPATSTDTSATSTAN